MVTDESVLVAVGSVRLGGHLVVPEDARGMVLFAHGSGSSRHSSRNRFVASLLNQSGFGTLLFDLLTAVEEENRANVFDIPMLGDRLGEVTDWVRTQPVAEKLAIGYFGASTGAGAALVAASRLKSQISAVVSRGGRPDLAGESLPEVTAPTLLIVGGRDRVVERLNREAQERLVCENRLEIVPRATHLFEEPGAMDEVARLAGDWFVIHLTGPREEESS